MEAPSCPAVTAKAKKREREKKNAPYLLLSSFCEKVKTAPDAGRLSRLRRRGISLVPNFTDVCLFGFVTRSSPKRSPGLLPSPKRPRVAYSSALGSAGLNVA